jgi:TP901 family phage tail tape measure protein
MYNRASQNWVTQNVTTRKGIASLNQGMAGLALRFVGYNLILNQVMGAQQKFIEFTKESITKFREFEKAVAEVSTILDSTTMRTLPELRSGMEQLSVTFGKAAVDMAGGTYQILSAAFAAEDAIQLLTIATKAAVAGLSDVETSVDILTSVLNAYGMTASQAARISDYLFQTVVRGKLRYEDFASALGYITPIAANAGWTFKEISAALSTATRMGLHADMTVRGLALGLQNLINPTEKVIKAARKYDIELGALSVRTLGLQGMIQQLHDASEKYGDHIIGEIIPNMRSLRVYSALAGDEGIDGLRKDMDLLTESAGRTEEAMSKITKTTQFMSDQLTQAMEQIKRDFGAAMTFIDLNIERTKMGVMLGVGSMINSIGEFGQSWTDLLSPLTFFWDAFTTGADEANLRIQESFNATAKFVANTIKAQYAETGKMSLYEALIGEDGDIDEIIADLAKLEDIEARIGIKGEQARAVNEMANLLATIEGQFLQTGQTAEDYTNMMARQIETTQKYSLIMRNFESDLLLTENAWNEVTGALASFEMSQTDLETTINQITISLGDLKEEVGKVGEMYDGTLGEQLAHKEAVATLEDEIRALQRTMKGQAADLSLVSDEMRAHIERVNQQKEAYDELSLAMQKNQIQTMKIQLKGMMRRRGLLRNEQKLLKKFQIENAKIRIEQMQMKIDAEEAGEQESKEILNEELRAMRDTLYAMKDTRWEDIENLRETIREKEDEISEWTTTLGKQQDELERITGLHTTFISGLYTNMADSIIKDFERISGYVLTPTSPNIITPTVTTPVYTPRPPPTPAAAGTIIQTVNATIVNDMTARQLADLLGEATRSALINQQGRTRSRVR